MTTSEWSIGPSVLSEISGTVGVTFEPYELDHVGDYYDYQPGEDSQFILASNPTLEEDTMWFFSPQAPDPLEIDITTGVLYDIDSTTALGKVQDVFIPSPNETRIESNRRSIESLFDGEATYATLDIEDPRVIDADAEQFNDEEVMVNVYVDRALLDVSDGEFNPGDNYDSSKPVTTLADGLGDEGVVSELARVFAPLNEESIDQSVSRVGMNGEVTCTFPDDPEYTTVSFLYVHTRA